MSDDLYIDQTGGLLVDAGSFLLCSQCPCDEPCYADVIAAIRERQKALGWTIWAADVEKLLSECISEVNAMAPSFYQTYTAPSASLPTPWSASYASGASDFCELLELIRALHTTKYAAVLGTGGRKVGNTGSTFSTLAAAIADAIANANLLPVITFAGSEMWLYKFSGSPQYRAILEWRWADCTVSTATGVDRTIKLFLKTTTAGFSGSPAGSYIFNAQGAAWPTVAYQYCLASSVVVPSDQAQGTLPAPGLTTPPVNSSEPPAGGSVSIGYSYNASFILCDWSFTYL